MISMTVVIVILLYKEEQDEERINSKWHDADSLFEVWRLAHKFQDTFRLVKWILTEKCFSFYDIHQIKYHHTSLLIGVGIDPIPLEHYFECYN